VEISAEKKPEPSCSKSSQSKRSFQQRAVHPARRRVLSRELLLAPSLVLNQVHLGVQSLARLQALIRARRQVVLQVNPLMNLQVVQTYCFPIGELVCLERYTTSLECFKAGPALTATNISMWNVSSATNMGSMFYSRRPSMMFWPGWTAFVSQRNPRTKSIDSVEWEAYSASFLLSFFPCVSKASIYGETIIFWKLFKSILLQAAYQSSGRERRRS
jgi:hypothetical protein